jgi:TNF receptor-associated protein 1
MKLNSLADGVKRGTKIILQLKEDEKEFSIKESVERIIKKYSNFVGFDIKLNGSKVNTQKAIWLQSKNSVSSEEYKEFYKYMTHSSNEPFYTIHFNTDVPMSIHALFYVPDSHSEKLGMGKMEPGVNVYCRKVLIQAKHRDILPDWLRFIKGAVDSEDLPLHISREHLQNSPLIRRINGILTRKIIRYFEDMLKQDMKKYMTFYEEFNRFFKEGISSDLLYKDEIAKILIFETSNTQPDERITLTDYVNRMPEDQKDIYYLIAPNRSYAESSPYFEAFKSKNIEVLFLFNPVDEFVMTSIGTYNKKSLKSIERTEIQNKETKEGGLTDEQIKELEKWFVSVLNGKLSALKSTNRLSGWIRFFLTLPQELLRLFQIQKIQQ